MSVEPRWAARHQLLRELWEGRDRILVDPGIDAVLGGRRPGGRGPAQELIADLLGRGGGRVWVVAADARAQAAGRRLPGVEVVDDEGAIRVVEGAPWEVAIVDLSRFLGEHAAPSRMLRRDLPGLARRLDRRAIALLDALADGAARGKVIALSVAASDVKVAEFQGLVEACFERAHLVGLAPLPVIAAIDFGEIVRDQSGGAGDAEVGIAFDNSLGSDPVFSHYVAVVGQALPGGLTLLEVPPEGPAPAAREATDTLRIQLAQARRQLELAAMARESLVEQLDAAQGRVGGLEDRCTELESRLAEAAWAPGEGTRSAAGGEVGGAAQATIQGLRWEIERAREEVRRLAERPIGAIEAENAALRARLEAAGGAEEAPAQAGAAASGPGPGTPGPGVEVEFGKARALVDLLVRRLERGGIGRHELRRKLTELAAMLGPDEPAT